MTEQQQELREQMARNAARMRELLPDGATPETILRGDYGDVAQRTYLLGAFTCLDDVIESPAKFGLTPPHDLEPGDVFERSSFYDS